MAEEKVYLRSERTGIEYPLNGFVPPAEDTDPSTAPLFGASPSSSSSFSFSSSSSSPLPSLVDLREQMTPVEHQLNLLSCVANAVAAACEYLIQKKTKKTTTTTEKGKHVDLSRLYIYYYSRLKDVGTENLIRDQGTQPASAIAVMSERGCCEEETYPYAESSVNARPPTQCDLEARKYRVVKATPVPVELSAMKRCLADGYPFVFGLHTFRSFDEANAKVGGKRGEVPPPDPHKEMDHPGHGWHCMLAVGYDDERHAFTVMNSWGTDWGDGGYCYVPYAYMSEKSLCMSLRAITEINVPSEATLSAGTFTDNSWFWGDNTPPTNLKSSGETTVTVTTTRATARPDRGTTKGERPTERAVILWMDEETPEHQGYVKELQQVEKNFEVHFSSSYANGEKYLREHKEQIQTSHRFLIICRGYFKPEKKNPFDLLQFLDRHDLRNQPTIVFTSNKTNLTERLDDEAKSKGMNFWKRCLELTDEKNEFISKITYYLKR